MSRSSSRRRRPREFLLPSGRRIIVAVPEDASHLREKHNIPSASDQELQVEVVLHGSPEHRDYLAEAERHHSSRREALRKKHGDVFDEWHATQTELDAAKAELERLKADEQNGGALRDNFTKFGYSAGIRTYEDDEAGGSPRVSRAMSLADAGSVMNEDDVMRLFKRPVIKQYIHRGLLWRASEETQITSVELFFDLLYGELPGYVDYES